MEVNYINVPVEVPYADLEDADRARKVAEEEARFKMAREISCVVEPEKPVVATMHIKARNDDVRFMQTCLYQLELRPVETKYVERFVMAPYYVPRTAADMGAVMDEYFKGKWRLTALIGYWFRHWFLKRRREA